jgi:hypothetical protein
MTSVTRLVAGATISALSLIFFLSSPVLADTNLVTNPGAESNGAGWTTILNSGDGMSYDFDGVVRSGTHSFQTSFGLDSISQRVDLVANGYPVQKLDFAPPITFSVWAASRGDQAGRYYVKFTLLAADGTTVLASTNFGDSGSLISIPAGTGWFQLSHTFSGYGSGVRYAYIEFGGRDQSNWAGHYGTHFDDASITVTPTVSGGAGANSMPPSGSMPPAGPFRLSLQGDASTTPTPDVTLESSVSPDVDRMALSRTADFSGSGIIPYTPSFPWSLCESGSCPPGVYDVYAKFYQLYGLSSPVQHLTVTYQPPQPIQPMTSMVVPTANQTDLPTRTDHPSTPLFPRNLRPRDRGEDVKRLQQFLNTHGYPLASTGIGSPGQETDVFGPALQHALARFQEANKTSLLAPYQLKTGTGFFGTQTRTFVNGLLDTKGQ